MKTGVLLLIALAAGASVAYVVNRRQPLPGTMAPRPSGVPSHIPGYTDLVGGTGDTGVWSGVGQADPDKVIWV